jgi:hypothetical protein
MCLTIIFSPKENKWHAARSKLCKANYYLLILNLNKNITMAMQINMHYQTLFVRLTLGYSLKNAAWA